MGSGASSLFCCSNQVLNSPFMLLRFQGMMGDEVVKGFYMFAVRLFEPVDHLTM